MHPSSVTLIGRYEVLAQLGRGAMGVVYQARDPQIDRLVAIKTILWMGDEPDESQSYRQRFLQEAKAAGRLSHPGIVQVFDVGEDRESNAPFIVMEYVAGQSLNKVLSASPGAKIALEDALRLTQEIAESLAYAHSQGVVHRDIKPANILVTEDGHAKIADFGVAKLDFANLTIAGHAVGTPAYMSPEQLEGGLVDGRADLFSLGVILYSMLAGFRPFQGRGNSTIAHKVRHGEPLPVSTFDVHFSPEVDALIARAMAKDPADRFQTGTEMAAAIRKIRGLDGRATTTDVQAVMQETRSHVACMDPDKNGRARPTGGNAAKSVQPSPAKKASQPTSKPSTGNGNKPGYGIAAFSSRKAVATTLAAALLAACALAWRLHAAMQPQALPSPVTWEEAQPIAQSSQSPAATSAATEAPTDVASTSEIANTPAEIADRDETSPTPNSAAPRPEPKKSHEKAVARDQADDIAPDKTVHLGQTTRTTRLAAKQASITANSVAADKATVQVALEHSFDQAQVTVWVGDQQVLADTIHGEKKRVLMFQRTHGTFMNKVSVPAGSHLVRVRIQSPADSFDASQSVNGDFAKAKDYVLHARCDKKHNELKLELEPVTLTSSADTH
jgi:serine/threonine-protein kinase